MDIKFKVGDYVKKIKVRNINSITNETFEVGEVRKVTKINQYHSIDTYYMVEVEGMTGGNDPDYLELYIPTKLEKALK